MTRRRLGGMAGAGLGLLLLGGCGGDTKWHAIDVAGSSPPLEFTMTRAADGKTVTEADYRGRIVMLYFGYTYCPDVCPTTLANIDEILKRLGPADAQQVSVLFVTVDPKRDSLPVLAAYTKNFGPEVVGLRGTDDQIARLARRYRVVYSVTTDPNEKSYSVTHSSAIYVFDRSGAARLLVPSLATTTPDIAGTADDLTRLVQNAHPPGLLARLLQSV